MPLIVLHGTNCVAFLKRLACHELQDATTCLARPHVARCHDLSCIARQVARQLVATPRTVLNELSCTALALVPCKTCGVMVLHSSSDRSTLTWLVTSLVCVCKSLTCLVTSQNVDMHQNGMEF